MLSEVGIAYFNNSWNFLCLESQAEADWEREKKNRDHKQSFQ